MTPLELQNSTVLFQDGSAMEFTDSVAQRENLADGFRRLVVICGIVTPYTHELYERVGRQYGIELHVFTCSDIEPGRHWLLPDACGYRRKVMSGFRWHFGDTRNLYFNPSAAWEILRLKPDALVLCDFTPTMLLSALTAALIRIPIIHSSDTQPKTDPGRHSRLHRASRRLIAMFAHAAIGGSAATLKVFETYGIGRGRLKVSPIVPAWELAGPVPGRDQRAFDLLFCGTIEDKRKGALHFLETVRELHARGRKPRIRVVGDGELRNHLEREFARMQIDAQFDGYLQQDQIADAYLSSKVLLFPSRSDPWGLVANEAAQSGTPIVISPHAEAAFELVEPFRCGIVRSLDSTIWADAVEHYLDDADAWTRASAGGVESRAHFSLDNATHLFVEGIALAMEK